MQDGSAHNPVQKKVQDAVAPLQLRAADAEDLMVLSSLLQDAIVPVAEMAFLPDEGRFVMILSRYRWEACASVTGRAGHGGGPERVLCGVCFEAVEAATTRNLDLADREAMLELLTILPEEDGGAVCLEFAGHGAVRLKISSLRCRMDDLGEPWPVLKRPAHSTDDGDDDGDDNAG